MNTMMSAGLRSRNPETQGVDPRVDFIAQRLQQIQAMQEMAAKSGHLDHSGHGGHGHSHDGQPCDGHSHDPERMNSILQRMQKFVQMQAQGGEAGQPGQPGQPGQAGSTENQAKAMQVMEMIKQMQGGMMGAGPIPMAAAQGHGHGNLPHGHSHGNQASDPAYPDAEEEKDKMAMMSGDIAANAPHRQKNWAAYTGHEGTGPQDSLLHGGGHFTPPVFGWGELVKDPEDPSDRIKPSATRASKDSTKIDMFKMPHEVDSSGGVIQATLPIVGRIRFLTDKQGLFFWGVVVLYWIMGNFSTWFCILLPQYADGNLSVLWLVVYGIVSALCITSHLRASTLNPGRVPYYVSEQSVDHPDWSYCHQCDRKRPPRAHHCRRCKQCVLKMDHHCPWINNCVGEENQWAFILLITYAQLLSSFTLAFNILWYWKMPACQSCDPMSFAIYHQKALLITVTIMAVLMILFSMGLLCSQNMGIMLDYTTLEWMQLERTVTATGKIPESKDMPRVKGNIIRTYRTLCGDSFFCLWPFPCRRRIAPVLKRLEDV